MTLFGHKRCDKNQLIVDTPYGRGLVINTRRIKHVATTQDAIKEVRLLDWEHGTNTRTSFPKKVPMLYTAIDYPSVMIRKGDAVLTPYGRGVVEEIVFVKIRKTSKDRKIGENNSKDEQILFKYRILLTSWYLAGRSRVKCYLFSPQVKVVRCKTVGEMDPIERVEYAMKQKQIAGKLFAEKNYSRALNKYAEAVDAVRYIQHTPNNSNECRADLLVVIVTCSNNAATCCIHLEKFDEASRFSRNALILLNALHGKQGMKIHGILMKDHQLTDAKLFGEWRGKSSLIIARCEMHKNFFDRALEHLREAKDFISVYIKDETSSQNKRLKEILKDVLKLKSSTIVKKKAMLEEEKAKAKKMFSGNVRKEQTKAKKAVSGNQIEKSPSQTLLSKSEMPMNKSQLSSNSKYQEESIINEKNSLKKVSFAEKLEERHVLEHEDEDEEPWYEEHKEALLLLTLGSLALFTTMFATRKK